MRKHLSETTGLQRWCAGLGGCLLLATVACVVGSAPQWPQVNCLLSLHAALKTI